MRFGGNKTDTQQLRATTTNTPQTHTHCNTSTIWRVSRADKHKTRDVSMKNLDGANTLRKAAKGWSICVSRSSQMMDV